MQRDFKTGMVLGLVLIIIALACLSTRPSLSIKAKMMGPGSVVLHKTRIPLQGTAIGRNTAKQTENKQSKEIKKKRFHIVRSGETLSSISRQYYGSPDKWQKILGANGLPIENPSKLKPGTKLIVPE